jgi:hypothetical protein
MFGRDVRSLDIPLFSAKMMEVATTLPDMRCASVRRGRRSNEVLSMEPYGEVRSCNLR